MRNFIYLALILLFITACESGRNNIIKYSGDKNIVGKSAHCNISIINNRGIVGVKISEVFNGFLCNKYLPIENGTSAPDSIHIANIIKFVEQNKTQSVKIDDDATGQIFFRCIIINDQCDRSIHVINFRGYITFICGIKTYSFKR
jgi:hypothetical protein